MAYVFHISRTPEALYALTENTFDDNSFMRSFDRTYSAKNSITTSPDLRIKDQMMALCVHIGMSVRKIAAPASAVDTDYLYEIQMTSDSKHQYFKPAFDQLKTSVEKMTPEEFEDCHIADRLETIALGNSSDMILYSKDTASETLYTFDAFLRMLQPDTIYYIHPVTLLMY